MSAEKNIEKSTDPVTIEADSKEIRDITVIGAGPVGLAASFWAGMRETSVRIVESLPTIGGQITTLYPEKMIFDIVGHPQVLGHDLVELLKEQSIGQFDIPVHLEATAQSISYEEDPEDKEKTIVRLTTSSGDLLSRALVIAGGHGAFEPKKLPGVDLDPWEHRGLHYIVSEKSIFSDKRVVIIGGGDSACDWALGLLDTASEITLIHRRNQFRAHEGTAAQIKEAGDSGSINVLTPFQVTDVSGDGQIERIVAKGGDEGELEETIDCDAVLLQLGFKTHLGPMNDWGLEIEKNAIKVSHLMETNLDAIWACGDITTFDGKLKLIATGFSEAAIAVAQAVHHIRPETKIQPKYSSNIGVPGESKP